MIPFLYLLAGIGVYAAFTHLSIGLRQPFDFTHLLFSGMCVFMVLYTLTHAQVLQAVNISGFARALKLNFAAILIFFTLFLWFIAQYTGEKSRLFLVASSVLFAVLFVANLVLPYSVQYEQIDSIQTIYLPWGEAVTVGVGRNSMWAYLASVLILAQFAYALNALGRLYYRNRNYADLGMIFAVCLFLLGTIEAILNRLSVIELFEFGPYAFLIMVIVMSIVLSYKTQRLLLISEHRFKSLVDQSPFSIQVLSPDGSTHMVNQSWKKLWDTKFEEVANNNILQDKNFIEKGVMPYIQMAFAGKASEIPSFSYIPPVNEEMQGPARERWIHGYIYPIKDNAGSVENVIMVQEDVTALRKLNQLEVENIYDELTKVYNRRYLENRLDEEVSRAKRYTQPLSLLMLDIDHFKRVNDTYGHQAGDITLSTFTGLIKDTLRELDVIARYGGEEFVVICTNTALDGATLVAERLRQLIELLLITIPGDSGGSQTIRVSVSIGVATLNASIDNKAKLIKVADEALYRAKAEGRNRVAVAGTTN